jgi:pyruvyl transferase EpsO
MGASVYSQDNVRKGILHYLFGRGMSGVAGFAVIILLVRYMDVQNYAGYTALNGLTMFAGILAGLGLERAISRYVPEGVLHHSTDALGRFIWIVSYIRFAIATLISIGVYFAWNHIDRLFADINFQYFPLPLALFIVAETLFQHFTAVLQAIVMQKTLTKIMVIQWSGRLLLLIPLVSIYKNLTIEQVLWVMTLPELAGVVVFVLVIRQRLRTLAMEQTMTEVVIEPVKWPPWRGVVEMAAHNYGFNLLAAPPQGYFMKMMVAIFLPANMVAAYGFFLSIAERMRQYIPLHLLYNLIEPVMIAKYIQDKDFGSLNHRCQLLYKTNLLLLIPALALVAAAGGYVISLLTGGKYHEYVWILCVVIVQLTIGSHVVLLQLILNSVGASRLLVKASICALVVMVAFGLIIAYLNPTMILLAPITFSAICNIYIIRQLAKMGYPYRIEWSMISPIFGAGGVAFAVVFCAVRYFGMVTGDAMMSLLSGIGIAMVYLPALWIFKAVNLDELSLLKSFIVSRHR